jgi:hypothetical protein
MRPAPGVRRPHSDDHVAAHVAGSADGVRVHWLSHPRLRGAEVRLTPTMATLVATYLG